MPPASGDQEQRAADDGALLLAQQKQSPGAYQLDL